MNVYIYEGGAMSLAHAEMMTSNGEQRRFLRRSRFRPEDYGLPEDPPERGWVEGRAVGKMETWKGCRIVTREGEVAYRVWISPARRGQPSTS
jgi:hypothetical protein